MPLFDFDRAWRERAAAQEEEPEPLRLVVKGETVELPPRQPAAFSLRFHRMRARLRSDPAYELQTDELVALSVEVIPAEQLDRILATGIDDDQMAEIVSTVMAHYMGLTEEQMRGLAEVATGGGGQGEARAPRGRRQGSRSRSSTTGRRSKPTSSESTAETSAS